MTDTDKPRLAFVENRSVPEGFRSGEGVNDEIVVRELVQNALDADATKVCFRIARIPVDELPDIEGYREAIAAINPDLKQTPIARAALESIQGALSVQTVTCLFCEDNGTGLSLREYRRLLAKSMSPKVGTDGAGKLGSVGAGHLTALDASDLRYVVYASSGEDGPIFGGQTMLAGQLLSCADSGPLHRVGQGCLTSARHVANFRGFEAHPAEPASLPVWLQVPERGTTVVILAYNSLDEPVSHAESRDNLASDPYLDRIFDAVAKHFMVALRQRRLEMVYQSDMRTEISLDETEVRRRLEAKKHQLRAKKGRRGYGSGANAWAAWETLTEGNAVQCKDSSLWWRYTPGKTTNITVFRNGMRITDDAPKLGSSDFSGFRAFNAVFDAAGELATVIKECETDSHLEINTAKAPGDAGKDAIAGLTEVQEILKGAVGEQPADEWIPDVLRIFDTRPDARDVEVAPLRPTPPPPPENCLGLSPNPDRIPHRPHRQSLRLTHPTRIRNQYRGPTPHCPRVQILWCDLLHGVRETSEAYASCSSRSAARWPSFDGTLTKATVVHPMSGWPS